MTFPPSVAAGLFHGLFCLEPAAEGAPALSNHPQAPAAIPDPASGRMLRVATADARSQAICPSCAVTGRGGFVSFVDDLRLAYACPSCREFVWLAGL